ncbi:MAG: hypothetical protein H7A38_04835 [Chlamydiales bacterium]|nr:hypothetical protein [Chlamydiales bacterium]
MAGVGNTSNHFLSRLLWGDAGLGEASFDGAPNRTWWDTASDLWEAVKWVFSALRDSYITCYRSPNLDSPDERARAQLQEMRSLWFPDTIPLSTRMGNMEFVIQRFAAHPKVEGIITAFFARQKTQKPEGLTVERFFREYIFALPHAQTVTLPNPEPKQAFWKSKQELEDAIGTLVDSFAEEGVKKLEDAFRALNDCLGKDFQVESKKAADRETKKRIEGEYQQNLTRERAARDQKIQEHKASVHREIFGEETANTLADNRQKLRDCLDRYFWEHFSEER